MGVGFGGGKEGAGWTGQGGPVGGGPGDQAAVPQTGGDDCGDSQLVRVTAPNLPRFPLKPGLPLGALVRAPRSGLSRRPVWRERPGSVEAALRV